MAGLGETTARLVRLRKTLGAGGGGADPLDMFEVREFGANPGALRLKAYVPTGLIKGAPLIVVLHGCTQTAGGYARGAGWLALADRFGFAVLAPEQDRKNNVNACFNWFEPQDTRRGAGEAASIQSMVAHLVRAHDLDAKRVYVTGLSAGGAMAAALLAAYPETFAGGAVVAGLPYGVASSMPEAFAAMGGANRLSAVQLGDLVKLGAPGGERAPRLTIWHGLADHTVASTNGVALQRQWTALHGLPDQPDEVVSKNGWTRSTWKDGDGLALVESNFLVGVGHGTPIATEGADGVGEPGPFLLEVGVSSSLEIMRFWGLAPSSAWAQPLREPPRSLEPAQQGGGVGEGVMATVSQHTPARVQEVIASALKKAGLLG